MIMAACYVKCSTGSDIGRGIHRRMPLCRIVSDNVFFGCAHPSEHGLHSRHVVLVLSCLVCRRYEMDWEGRKMAVLMRARHRDRDRESKVLATVEPKIMTPLLKETHELLPSTVPRFPVRPSTSCSLAALRATATCARTLRSPVTLGCGRLPYTSTEQPPL